MIAVAAARLGPAEAAAFARSRLIERMCRGPLSFAGLLPASDWPRFHSAAGV
jgi:hypothetical protein